MLLVKVLIQNQLNRYGTLRIEWLKWCCLVTFVICTRTYDLQTKFRSLNPRVLKI